MKPTLQSDNRVCIFERIQGTQQDPITPGDKMDVQAKVSLLNNGSFSEKLGKSMMIMQIIGLNDHLNPGGPGNSTNFGNLMISQSGDIHVIDPSMTTTRDLQNDTATYGFSTERLTEILLNSLNTLSDCDTLEGLQDHLNRLINPKRLSDADETKPFDSFAMAVLGTPADEGTFFKPNEKNEQTTISKGFVVANFMKGVMEGLLFIDRNKDELSGLSNGLNMKTDVGASLDELSQRLSEMPKGQLEAIMNNLETAIRLTTPQQDN